MNFSNAVTIIQESYKNSETLQYAMNFLDAITLLQNTCKQKRNQRISDQRSSWYYSKEELEESRPIFYEKLSQYETVDEHIFDKVVRIGYGNVLLSFLTPTDAAKLSLVDRQCALAVYWQKSNETLRCSYCNMNYLDRYYQTRDDDLKGHSVDFVIYCDECPNIYYYNCHRWCTVKGCN